MRAEYEAEVRAILGDEGLALAAGASEFLWKLVEEIPVGFGLRLSVDRTARARDDVTLELLRRERGEVAFAVWSNGEGELELTPTSATPSPF